MLHSFLNWGGISTRSPTGAACRWISAEADDTDRSQRGGVGWWRRGVEMWPSTVTREKMFTMIHPVIMLMENIINVSFTLFMMIFCLIAAQIISLSATCWTAFTAGNSPQATKKLSHPARKRERQPDGQTWLFVSNHESFCDWCISKQWYASLVWSLQLWCSTIKCCWSLGKASLAKAIREKEKKEEEETKEGAFYGASLILSTTITSLCEG